MERVERVEELLLESFLASNELDVIDQEDIDVAVSPAKRTGGVLSDGVDVFVHERLS